MEVPVYEKLDVTFFKICKTWSFHVAMYGYETYYLGYKVLGNRAYLDLLSSSYATNIQRYKWDWLLKEPVISLEPQKCFSVGNHTVSSSIWN